ncbi:HNH endonuclease [Rubripirellula obstinata]|uniref:HNH endonuclease n=1 Tax=Rubripirellula obstinata TaxID=406547 RepID=A0A5B1CCB2_9BACT|nr:HNH endonuclease [Rubripirellula obstinata]KAA1257033.1 HNH endonuclease [Rubripirellula obstinata]
MTSYISVGLRSLVFERSGGRCEYCKIKDSDTFFGCQIDHIIAEKHGGETVESNLAFTCACCNRFKGTDIGSIAEFTGELVRFFNPRVDDWADHFHVDDFQILPFTPIGEVTCRILRFNSPERISEREAIGKSGFHG